MVYFMQLQKEVKSNPKQPSCKKVCNPKNAIVKKRCEIQSGGQKCRLIGKHLILTIQLNLVLSLNGMWRRQDKFS